VVLAAIQVSIVQVSRVGFVPHGWSDAETKSYPSVSAARASSTGSLSVLAGMFTPSSS